MTTPVETIAADATIAEAARVLDERGIGSLVVGDGRIDGILTESDVVASVGQERDPTETTVGDLMSEPVVTIRPHKSVEAAGDRMGSNGVKKLPVTEDGEAVGIVTTTDLALALPDYRVGMATQQEPDIGKGEYQ
jgi:CBS domain-containing protein